MGTIPAHVTPEGRATLTEVGEGRKLKAYPDPGTHGEPWTVGYGHTSRAGLPKVFSGMTITPEEADAILTRDLGVFERGVAALLAGVSFDVLPREFDALCDFSLNLGLGNLRSSSLLAAYRKGNKVLAAQKFGDWNKAAGRVLPGLTIRRRREASWFLYGHVSGTTAQLADIPPEIVTRVVDHPDHPIMQRWFAWRAPALPKES